MLDISNEDGEIYWRRRLEPGVPLEEGEEEEEGGGLYEGGGPANIDAALE
jgi:hypothetical protein